MSAVRIIHHPHHNYVQRKKERMYALAIMEVPLYIWTKKTEEVKVIGLVSFGDRCKRKYPKLP